jgi:hypothetical protein
MCQQPYQAWLRRACCGNTRCWDERLLADGAQMVPAYTVDFVQAALLERAVTQGRDDPGP